MRWITSSNLRPLQLTVTTAASCSTLIIIASIGIGDGNANWKDPRLYLLPQVFVNLYALLYTYFKPLISNRKLMQLGSSLSLAAAYIFFSVKVFPLVLHDNGLILLRVVEAADAVMAALLIGEAVLAMLVVNEVKPAASRSSPSSGAGAGGAADDTESVDGEQTAPQQVHIYNPHITLTPAEASFGAAEAALEGPETASTSVGSGSGTGSSSGTRSAQSPRSVEAEFRINIGALGESDTEQDDVELEELPKYQKRRPAQSATIIDLSNLRDVDPIVLSTVLGVESSAQNIAQPENSEDGHVPLEDAPDYTPPLSQPLSTVAVHAAVMSSASGFSADEGTTPAATAAHVTEPEPEFSSEVQQQQSTTHSATPAPTSEPPSYML